LEKPVKWLPDGAPPRAPVVEFATHDITLTL
jgi:hypothetical protein